MSTTINSKVFMFTTIIELLFRVQLFQEPPYRSFPSDFPLPSIVCLRTRKNYGFLSHYCQRIPCKLPLPLGVLAISNSGLFAAFPHSPCHRFVLSRSNLQLSYRLLGASHLSPLPSLFANGYFAGTLLDSGAISPSFCCVIDISTSKS